MNREIIITKDNSHTLFVPDLNEHYHSIFGAIKESMHVFINAGLRHIGRRSTKIFEVGFGTGLNTLLTLVEALQSGMEVCYYAIDNYILDLTTIKQLNYPDLLLLDEETRQVFYRMHSQPWDKEIKLADNFKLIKIKSDITKFQITFQYDLVYFDAFAPDKQPGMWSSEIFKKLYNSLSEGGILVTYCAKGNVKRTLRSAGFTVTSIPGPPGKREMIRASKKKKIL